MTYFLFKHAAKKDLALENNRLKIEILNINSIVTKKSTEISFLKDKNSSLHNENISLKTENACLQAEITDLKIKLDPQTTKENTIHEIVRDTENPKNKILCFLYQFFDFKCDIHHINNTLGFNHINSTVVDIEYLELLNLVTITSDPEYNSQSNFYSNIVQLTKEGRHVGHQVFRKHKWDLKGPIKTRPSNSKIPSNLIPDHQ